MKGSGPPSRPASCPTCSLGLRPLHFEYPPRISPDFKVLADLAEGDPGHLPRPAYHHRRPAPEVRGHLPVHHRPEHLLPSAESQRPDHIPLPRRPHAVRPQRGFQVCHPRPSRLPPVVLPDLLYPECPTPEGDRPLPQRLLARRGLLRDVEGDLIPPAPYGDGPARQAQRARPRRPRGGGQPPRPPARPRPQPTRAHH